MNINTAIDNIITQVENNRLAVAYSSIGALVSQIYADMKDFSTHAVGSSDDDLTEEVEALGLVVTGLENAGGALLSLDSEEALSCLQAAKR